MLQVEFDVLHDGFHCGYYSWEQRHSHIARFYCRPAALCIARTGRVPVIIIHRGGRNGGRMVGEWSRLSPTAHAEETDHGQWRPTTFLELLPPRPMAEGQWWSQ